MEAGSQKRAPVYEALEQLKREESFLSMCRGTREGVATRSSWNFWGRNV